MTFGEFRRNCDNAYYDLTVFIDFERESIELGTVSVETRKISVSLNLENAADRAAAMKYDGAMISRFRAGVVEMGGETLPLLEVELYV